MDDFTADVRDIHKGFFDFVATRKVKEEFQFDISKCITSIQIDNIICILNLQAFLCSMALDFRCTDTVFQQFLYYSDVPLKVCKNTMFVKNVKKHRCGQ